MTVLCLGDSLTAGYGLSQEEAYPDLVQSLALADKRPWTVINAGISGDTTASALRRLDWALKAKPDAVLVALGGNDGLRGIAICETRANVRLLVTRIRASGALPLLAGMQLPKNYGEDFRSQFAGIYPQLAQELKVPLLPFLLEGGRRAGAQSGRRHPSYEGGPAEGRAPGLRLPPAEPPGPVRR